MLPMKIDGRLQIFDEAARQSALTHPRCCAADRPIRNARVPQAIGQSFDWLVPAEAEVLGARVADRPAAFPLELEQRASASVVDRDVFSRRLRPWERRHQHLMLGEDVQARTRCGLGNAAISISCWAKMFRRGRFERQVLLGVLGRASLAARLLARPLVRTLSLHIHAGLDNFSGFPLNVSNKGNRSIALACQDAG
jgi:hypothetical protein